jgi:inositol phosphorylceramide mannosyltransferase catalytic subunit
VNTVQLFHTRWVRVDYRWPRVVPRILHQIWVGRDSLPDEYAGYVETWKRHHPEWEHRLWTEENLPTDVRRPEVLERIRHPVERADILRYEVLWRHGGVYVDVDFECRRSLESEIGDAEFFTAYLKPKNIVKARERVNNAFIGSVPGHPLLDRALNELRPQEWYGFDKGFSGSDFFNALVKQFPDVQILDAELIYPNSPEQEAAAVCIHHFARAWADLEGYRKLLYRAEKRLREVRGELEEEQRMHAETKRRLKRAKAQGGKSGKESTGESRLGRFLAR